LGGEDRTTFFQISDQGADRNLALAKLLDDPLPCGSGGSSYKYSHGCVFRKNVLG
jgi:hypothetical protein